MDASAHTVTVSTHEGVYLGTFFCMKASDPAAHGSRTAADLPAPAESDRDRVQVVHQMPFGGVRPAEERLVKVGEPTPSR